MMRFKREQIKTGTRITIHDTHTKLKAKVVVTGVLTWRKARSAHALLRRKLAAKQDKKVIAWFQRIGSAK